MRWDKVNVVDVEANVVYFFENGYGNGIYFLDSICFLAVERNVEKWKLSGFLLWDLIVEKLVWIMV